MDRIATLQAVLEGLLHRYQERVPDVGTIIAALIAEGVITEAGEIENDHIAFRTLGVPSLGIGSFEKIFLHYGYERRDPYDFPAKKLSARWYSPPAAPFPRIFVSELRVSELSERAQRIITSYTGEVRHDPVENLDLEDAGAVDRFLHQPLWRLPSWDDYVRLQQESEYAAWVIYNRYYLNHFTIGVHNLPPGYDTITDFNRFLVRHGITLNDAGGTIKESPDGNLLQSATVAEMVDALFAGGVRRRISGSYVEFAERRILPEYQDLPRDRITRRHRREGFEAANADRIFESTYTTQTAHRLPR